MNTLSAGPALQRRLAPRERDGFPAVRVVRLPRAFAAIVAAIAAAACGAEQTERPPVVAGYERFGRAVTDPADRVEAGLLLLGELGCINCHSPGDQSAAHLFAKTGPILDGVGNRLDPAWLERYLASPHSEQPGTTMPDLLAADHESQRKRTATALAQFLASSGTFDRDAPTNQEGNPGEGIAIHDRVGCTACHAPLSPGGSPLPDHLPGVDLAAKWGRASLDAFLRDPLSIRPSSRMPSPTLNNQERRHVVAALLGSAPGVDVRLWQTIAFQGSAWNFSGSALPHFDSLGPPIASGPVTGFNVAALAGRNSNFAVRCDGHLHVALAGRYRFHLKSDDGSRLFVDGKGLIDNDGVHGDVERDGEVDLSAGVHSIRLEYFQDGGNRVLELDVTLPSGKRRSALAFVTPAANGIPLSAAESDDKDFRPDPALVAEGRKAFVQVGCANCHRFDAAQNAGVEPAPKPTELRSLRVAESGCLATTPARSGIPRYGLDDKQRGAIVVALDWLRSPAAAAPPVREQRVARTFAALNCYACHVRDGRGGTALAVATVDEDGERITMDIARDVLFTTHVKELGDEGRLPPPLTGVGDKLNPKFLRESMLNGCNDRQAYMHTRMPKWHADVVEPLATILEQDVTTTAAPPELAGRQAHELVDAGRYLVGSKALGCVKCHSYDGDRGQSLGVIAMARFPQRLRHDWFLAYVADPQRFRPGTRMPAAWPEGKPFFPDVADGTAAGQIESVWRYLTAPNRREPAGARGESIELVPTDRPVLYRNFISGAGVRAIGVGYPEKVNVAWDADLLRLALAWNGPFVDAGRQWSGRGECSTPPLGDGVFTPEATSVVAVLDAVDAAWPKEPPRQRGARFRGYVLDAAGRPSFIWSLDGMDVTESIVPATFEGRTGLRRTVSLRGMPKKGVVVFRAVQAAKIEELPDGSLLIDDMWRLRVPGAVAAVRRSDEGKTEIRYPATWVTPSAVPGGLPGAEQSTFVEELSW